jgi:hypothetical protein
MLCGVLMVLTIAPPISVYKNLNQKFHYHLISVWGGDFTTPCQSSANVSIFFFLI